MRSASLRGVVVAILLTSLARADVLLRWDPGPGDGSAAIAAYQAFLCVGTASTCPKLPCATEPEGLCADLTSPLWVIESGALPAAAVCVSQASPQCATVLPFTDP